MKDNFCLADKKIIANLNDCSQSKYRESDIKEAVRRLKYEILMAVESGYIDEEQFEYEEVIDKIFGKKLVEE